MKSLKIIIVSIVLLCALSKVQADEGLPRVVHAAMFPGVVQLNDGSTTKGLLYMGAEVALLSMAVNEVTKYYAYSRVTEYLKADYYDFSTESEERTALRTEWQQAYDDANKSKTMGMAFGTLAVAWWAWNIVDSYIFAPGGSTASTQNSWSDNLALTYTGAEAGLSYCFEF